MALRYEIEKTDGRVMRGTIRGLNGFWVGVMVGGVAVLIVEAFIR